MPRAHAEACLIGVRCALQPPPSTRQSVESSSMHGRRRIVAILGTFFLSPAALAAQDRSEDRIPEYKTVLTPDDARIAGLKREAIQRVDGMQKLTQEMVDMVF